MEKNKNQPIVKKYFDVRIEAMLPATLTYRVLAENPEQALQMIKNIPPNNVKYKLHGRKDLKASIYDAGTTLLRFVKRLLG